MREPLDILKDEWQGWENNQTSVLAYVEGAREKLKWMQKQARAVEHSFKKMSEEVLDMTARSRSF